MANHTKIRGTQETLFQLGISGPQIKNNSSVLEARNSDDSAYVVLRVATPTADNDAVTKYYADSLEKPMIVKRQADCTAALPANTGVRGWVVVSTAGTGAAIGDVLYDNGTSTGDMVIVAASEGRTIAVTDALTGGTVTFQADTVYVWDADGSAWVEIGGPGTGAIKEVRYIIDNSAAQDSVAVIPANAIITECTVKITTPYSAGATITVGSTSTATMCQATTDNNPLAANLYTVPQDTAWEATASVVRTAVANTPAAGAGVIIVKYTKPLV
jgi:hypothetical protein